MVKYVYFFQRQNPLTLSTYFSLVQASGFLLSVFLLFSENTIASEQMKIFEVADPDLYS